MSKIYTHCYTLAFFHLLSFFVFHFYGGKEDFVIIKWTHIAHNNWLDSVTNTPLNRYNNLEIIHISNRYSQSEMIWFWSFLEIEALRYESNEWFIQSSNANLRRRTHANGGSKGKVSKQNHLHFMRRKIVDFFRFSSIFLELTNQIEHIKFWSKAISNRLHLNYRDIETLKNLPRLKSILSHTMRTVFYTL